MSPHTVWLALLVLNLASNLQTTRQTTTTTTSPTDEPHWFANIGHPRPPPPPPHPSLTKRGHLQSEAAAAGTTTNEPTSHDERGQLAARPTGKSPNSSSGTWQLLGILRRKEVDTNKTRAIRGLFRLEMAPDAQSNATLGGPAPTTTTTWNETDSSASDNETTTPNSLQPNDAVPAYMQHMTQVLVVLHLSVFITGIVGNSLVCLSVYRNKSLQTVTNYYIVNLAVADFLVILICLPPTLYWDLTLTWNFGLILCKLVPYLQSMSVSVSVLTLTCISIDRWYAICRPLEFCSTKYRAKVIIGLIWLVSALIASPDVLFLTTKKLHEENDVVYTDCSHSWPENNTKIYQLCITTLLFVGPFVLMSISYWHIVDVLWRNQTVADSLQQAAKWEEEQQYLRRRTQLLAAETAMAAAAAATDCEAEMGPASTSGDELDDAAFVGPLVMRPGAPKVAAATAARSMVDARQQAGSGTRTAAHRRQPPPSNDLSATRPSDKARELVIFLVDKRDSGEQRATGVTGGEQAPRAVRDPNDDAGHGATEAGGRKRAQGDGGARSLSAGAETGMQESTNQGKEAAATTTINAEANVNDLLHCSDLEARDAAAASASKSFDGRRRRQRAAGSSAGAANGPMLAADDDDDDEDTRCWQGGRPNNGRPKSIETPARVGDATRAANDEGANGGGLAPAPATPQISRAASCSGASGCSSLGGSSAAATSQATTQQTQEEAARRRKDAADSRSGDERSRCCKWCPLLVVRPTTTTTVTTAAAARDSERLSGDVKTSKRYRKNLANYAAQQVKYNRDRGGCSEGGGQQQRRHVKLTRAPTITTTMPTTSTTLAVMAPRSEINNFQRPREAPKLGQIETTGAHEEAAISASGGEESTAAGVRLKNGPKMKKRRKKSRQSCEKSSSMMVANSSSNNNNNNNNSAQSANSARFCKLIESRKKAAKMLIVIVIMFGLCYLPVHFLNTLRNTIGLPQNDITTIASLVSHWLCYFNSAVNPLIYNLMSGKFRHEFADLFFCQCFRR